MEKLSDRWMFYCGLLAGMGVGVDDLKHIQDLIDAEEQGLLLRLPCKEGTEVYLTDYPNNRFVIKEYKLVGMKAVMVLREFIHGSQCTRWVENIGETVFLTKEEAEQKLESMKGE